MTVLRNNCSIEDMNGGIAVVNIQTVVPVEIFLQDTPDIVDYVVENVKNILQEKINEIEKEEMIIIKTNEHLFATNAEKLPKWEYKNGRYIGIKEENENEK